MRRGRQELPTQQNEASSDQVMRKFYQPHFDTIANHTE